MDSGKLRQVGWKLGVVNCLVLVFLLGNLVIRFCTIFYYPPYNGYIAAFFGGLVCCCIFVVLFPKYLKAFLFIFGFSFFLFGFGSIDIQSRVFELIVTCVATTLFVIIWRGNETHQLNPSQMRSAVVNELHPDGIDGKKRFHWAGGVNRPLVILILCYVALSLFSLLLLPVRQILKDLWFFGFPDSFYYLFIDPPYGFHYPISAIARLMLFVVLAFTLSNIRDSREIFKFFFSGIFCGAVFCAFIGLLDFYGIVPLAWYRFGITTSPGVLHSTFGNRGWFAEFILTAVPFVLIGFMSKSKGVWWKILLFCSLVICEITLILAGGRSGWVSYPFILFICWLFFYFSKEGRLDSFHFRWRDLIKVAVSVPITIVLSFVLIFYVLMPLSDYMKEHSNVKGIQKGGEATGQFIQRQAGRLLDPGKRGRLYTWEEGYNVGRESPLFGMCYESFCWHANILADVPESYCNEFFREARHIHQTPHNIFVSIFASGGIIGVCLWLLLAGYAVVILVFDLVRNKRLLNTPVIISIISFHIFGIFQSMQYIPMIWLLIFLCLGYAMTIDDGVLPSRLRRVFGVLTKVSVVLVVIGFFVYLNNFESKSLAEKYGLKIYAMDQDRDKFAGFFQPSQRWKYGDYRWFSKRGAVYVPGGGVELEFHCRTPGVEKEPLVLTVFHDGEVLDEITFTKKGSVKRSYELKAQRSKLRAGEKEEELLLEVSRTWIPHNTLGNFDRRNLGIGVKIVNGKKN